MREIFDELYDNQTADPMEAARRAMRPPLRKRFYERAAAGEGADTATLIRQGLKELAK